jgi:hypothetical protein
VRKVLVGGLWMLVGCGVDDNDPTDDDTTDEVGETDDDDADGDCPVPSDALTQDSISAGGASLTCFYAPPEGYCWESRDGFTLSSVATDGKGSVGCADGVAVTDGSCPLDLAIGRCDNWGTDEDRVYYECNKFDTIFPEGLDVACEDRGGTWTDL